MKNIILTKSFVYVYLPSSPKRSGKIACVSQTKKKGKLALRQWEKIIQGQFVLIFKWL